MKWILKGRTAVSDDGRFRVAKVFGDWILYDRGVGLGDYPSRESAIQKAEQNARTERECWGALA